MHEQKSATRRWFLVGAAAALVAPRARAESLTTADEHFLVRRDEAQKQIQSSYDALTKLIKGSNAVPQKRAVLRETVLQHLRPLWNAYGKVILELDILNKKIAMGSRGSEVKNLIQNYDAAYARVTELQKREAPLELEVYCSFVQNTSNKKRPEKHRGKRRYAKN